MNNSNSNSGRNRSQSAPNNRSGLALKRSNTRNKRAFSDPTPMSKSKSNENKRGQTLVSSYRKIKKSGEIIIELQKQAKELDSAIRCHEITPFFKKRICPVPKKIQGMNKTDEEVLEVLKSLRKGIDSSIKSEEQKIGVYQTIMNNAREKSTLQPVPYGSSAVNHKRNNFLNPNNMEHSSLPNVIHRRNNFLNPNNMQHSSLGGGKRRTRRIRRTRRHR